MILLWNFFIHQLLRLDKHLWYASHILLDRLSIFRLMQSRRRMIHRIAQEIPHPPRLTVNLGYLGVGKEVHQGEAP